MSIFISPVLPNRYSLTPQPSSRSELVESVLPQKPTPKITSFLRLWMSPVLNPSCQAPARAFALTSGEFAEPAGPRLDFRPQVYPPFTRRRRGGGLWIYPP